MVELGNFPQGKEVYATVGKVGKILEFQLVFSTVRLMFSYKI